MAADPLANAPERIRRLRAALGLTQARLAALLGVSALSIIRWENGQARPSALAWQLLRRLERELEEPLLRGSAGAAATAGRPQRFPVPSAGAFVGRERELQTLLDLLAAARRGQSRLALVSGEPGAGKTRLLHELAERAGRTGCQVLFGRADEAEGAPPYLPFAGSLREYILAADPQALQARLGEGGMALAMLVPEMRERILGTAAIGQLRGEPAGESQPAWARYRFHEEVADVLLSLARSSPASSPASSKKTGRSTRGLLLILDDLQWADRSTLLLLQHVARQAKAVAAPLLIAASYRSVGREKPHPLDELLAALSREQLAEELPLPPLSLEEVRRLVESLSGRSPAPAAAVALLHYTAGNAFFVHEMVRHLQTEGVRLDEGLQSPTGWSIPRGVRHVIGSRLSRLSTEAQQMLQAAAVLEDELSFDLLARVTDQQSNRLLDALDEAIAAGLMHQSRQPLGSLEASGSYELSHALIRQALLEELSAPRRQRLHLRAAEAIECASIGSPERGSPERRLAALARHYRLAGAAADGESVVHSACLAAEAATAVFAWEDAAFHWQTALDHLGPAQVGRRCELLLKMGAAQWSAGAIELARERFIAAAAAARSLSEAERVAAAAPLLAQAALGYAGLWTGPALSDALQIELLEEALIALGDEDSAERAQVLARLATSREDERPRSWPQEQIEALHRQAIAVARRLGEPGTLAIVLCAAHAGSNWHPDAEERLRRATEALRLARDAGDYETVLRGHRFRYSDLLELGDIAGAERALADYHRLAEELRQPVYRCLFPLYDARRALLEGRFADAERLGREALISAEALVPELAFPSYAIQLFTIRWQQGRLAQLEAEEPRVIERLARSAHSRPALALIDWEQGRAVEMHERFGRLAAANFTDLRRDWRWVAHLCLLAEVCTLLDLPLPDPRPEQLYELLTPFAEYNAVFFGGTACFGSVARYLGLLARAMNRQRDAARHFEAALALNAKMGGSSLVGADAVRLRGTAPSRSEQPSAISDQATRPPRLGWGAGAPASIARQRGGAGYGRTGRSRPCADRLTHRPPPQQSRRGEDPPVGRAAWWLDGAGGRGAAPDRRRPLQPPDRGGSRPQPANR